MKKIITLLFFAVLASAAFAQRGHRQKDNTQRNGNSYQSPRSENGNFGDTKNSRNEGYSDGQWNKRGHGNEYGHDGYRENRDRHGNWGDHRIYRDDSFRNRHRRIFFFRLFHHDRD